MKFQSHNLADAAPDHVDHFLRKIATRVSTTAPNGKEFRAIETIFASTERQVRCPLAILRLREPITVGDQKHKILYPPGSLVVLGWRRLAVEVEDPEDAAAV